MMQINKDDLFVLCCLWENRAYLRSIILKNAAAGFNISYKLINVYHSLEKLMDHGLLNFMPAPSKSGGNENNLVGLTCNGGRLWEACIHPIWHNYIYGFDIIELGGREYCYLGSFDDGILKSLAMKVVKSMQKDVMRIDIGSMKNIIYWKEEGGYAAIFMKNNGDPIDICDIYKYRNIYDILDAEYGKFYSDLSGKISEALN